MFLWRNKKKKKKKKKNIPEFSSSSEICDLVNYTAQSVNESV